jgi:hypothetical protein
MAAIAAQADCLVDGSTIFDIENIEPSVLKYLKVNAPIFLDDFEKTEQLKRLIIYGFYKNIEISKHNASKFFGRTEVTDLLSIKYTESDSNETLIMLCNFILIKYPVKGIRATTANMLVKKDVNILIRHLIFFLISLYDDNPLSKPSPQPPSVKPPAPPPHLFRESSSNLGGSKSSTSRGAALDTHSESLSELFKTMASKTREIDVKIDVQKLFNDFKTNEYHKIKKIMLDDIKFEETNLPCNYGVKQLFFGQKNILLTYHTRVGKGGVIKNKRKRRKSKKKSRRKSKKKSWRKSKKKGRRKSKRKVRRRRRRTKK